MNPQEVILPDTEEGLKHFYVLINYRLNNLWLEYTIFAESITSAPQTALIFPILFSELDFYEVLLERVRRKLPKEIIREIADEFYFSDW